MSLARGSVDRHRRQREAGRLQYAAHAPVARLLDPCAIADVGQQPYREIDRLVDARRDDHLVRRAFDRARDAQVIGERPPQRPVAAARRIGQQLGIRLLPQPRLQAAPRPAREFRHVRHARHERAPLAPRHARVLDQLPAAHRQAALRVRQRRFIGARRRRCGARHVDRGGVRPRVGHVPLPVVVSTAFGRQLVVHVQHGIARDRQVGRERARTRQLRTWPQFPVRMACCICCSNCRYIGSGELRSRRAESQSARITVSKVVLLVILKWFPIVEPWAPYSGSHLKINCREARGQPR